MVHRAIGASRRLVVLEPSAFVAASSRRALHVSLAGGLLLACGTFPPTRVNVIKTGAGEHAYREEGPVLPITHWQVATEAGPHGLARGFYVIRAEHEWRELWPTTDTDRIPLLPPDLDLSKEMLLVAAPDDPHVVGVEVKAVVDTEQNGVHAYVTQTLPGASCPSPSDASEAAFDVARIPALETKEVQFHLDTGRAAACGDSPGAAASCEVTRGKAPAAHAPKLAGEAPEPTPKLAVSPGASISCIAVPPPSSRPIFDRTWSFGSSPKWSGSKLRVAPDGFEASFAADLYGTYTLNLEVSDDLQRSGTTSVQVEARPPLEALVAQRFWAKFDPSTDTAKLPATQFVATPIASGNVKNCTETGTAPSWCNAKVAGATSILGIDPHYAKRYAFAVYYKAERLAGEPQVCVRFFRKGEQTTERCDDTARAAGDTWSVGIIDAESGLTPEALAAVKAAEAAKVAGAKAEADAKEAEAKEAAAAKDAAARDATKDAGASDGAVKPVDAAAPAPKAADAGAVKAPAASKPPAPKSDGDIPEL